MYLQSWDGMGWDGMEDGEWKKGDTDGGIMVEYRGGREGSSSNHTSLMQISPVSRYDAALSFLDSCIITCHLYCVKRRRYCSVLINNHAIS